MVTDALHYSQRLKWRWAGHIARMVDDRWTIRLTSWPGPAGHRKVGRPYARWSDDIAKVAGINWMQVAKDRDRIGTKRDSGMAVIRICNGDDDVDDANNVADGGACKLFWVFCDNVEPNCRPLLPPNT
ncbi:jg10039 [Pararge aegeria aegeria]|uniref:Jg10039 protein n=1 Tax=Pararge aegeria aegeria TaxID=348720 RepID=A0A8S4S8S0_9NEOP|nr:jg10039 [Pararge aegeria aegeria]